MGRKDPRPCLGIDLQNKVKKQMYPVHRLDFEVSGLVIFASSSHAQKILSHAFEMHQVQKTYEALSSLKEIPEVDQKFTWTCKLAKGKKRAFEAPHGKESITEAHFLGTLSGFGHWNLFPKTGRSHQLRFEMYRHEYPIVGDALYGSVEKYSEHAIALKAVRIEFLEKELAQKLQMSQFFEVSKRLID